MVLLRQSCSPYETVLKKWSACIKNVHLCRTYSVFVIRQGFCWFMSVCFTSEFSESLPVCSAKGEVVRKNFWEIWKTIRKSKGNTDNEMGCQSCSFCFPTHQQIMIFTICHNADDLLNLSVMFTMFLQNFWLLLTWQNRCSKCGWYGQLLG